MTPVTLSQFAILFAERLALCLLGGSLFAVATALLLRFGPFGARLRYLVWWSTLASAALLLIPQIAPSAGHMLRGSSPAPLTLPASWAIYALGLWATGSLIGFARIAFGALRVHRLRRTCTAISPDQLSPEFREALSAISKREVTVCTSQEVTVPCVLGFFRPAVVLPVDLIARLSDAELKQVLIHEIAHIRFWDDWANLLQKVVRSILFFHPAAWFIDRKLAAEREMACDDFVVQQTGDSRAYARCLTSLAEISLVRRTAALVQAALGRGSQTTARVTRLLGRSARGNQKIRPALSIAGVILVTAFSVRSFTPTLIGFSNPVHTDVEIAKHIAASQDDKQLAAPVQLASFHEQRTKPAITKKSVTPRPATGTSRASLARTQTRPQTPQLTLAAAKVPLQPTVHVQQAYFAVVDSDYDGVQSVSIYQLTVWHVSQAKAPKPADHKTT